MQTIYYKNLKHTKMQTLNQFRVGAWIHINEATQSDLDFVCKRFKLDESIVRDALDIFEVPRIEKEAGITYLITRFSYQKNTIFSTAPLMVIVGPDFFVTISPQRLPLIETFVNKKGVYTTQKTKLLLQMLITIDTSFERHVTNISKSIQKITTNIEEMNNKSIIELVQFESVFNEFLFGLVPDTTLLEKLLSGKFLKLFEEDRDLIEDLALTKQQLIKMSQANIKQLTNTRDTYSSITSNNLNNSMKFLTGITLILTIPTMIFSFYGMNVHLPLEGHPFSFAFIFVGTLLFSSGLLYVLTKKDLL